MYMKEQLYLMFAEGWLLVDAILLTDDNALFYGIVTDKVEKCFSLSIFAIVYFLLSFFGFMILQSY